MKTAPDGLALLVGGGNDGKRIFVSDLLVVRLPLPPQMQTSVDGFEAENYRKELLTTQNETFAFYVSESMSIEAALSRLFEHYTPHL